MEGIQKRNARFLVLVAFSLVMTLILVAQSTPVLNQGYAGAVAVSGKVIPGNGPVSIYDISYPARTKLGTSQSVDGSGNFAATVKPPLVLNHQIVAVDVNGATSQPMVVAAPPSSPSRPGN